MTKTIGKIGVFAPSSWVEKENMERTQALLKEHGIETYIHPQTYLRHNQSAGTSADKLKAFHELYSDPEITHIWAAGGGNRCLHWIDDIDYASLKEEKPVRVSEVFILKTGELTITSEPTGALIHLIDSYQGKTPHTISELAIGDYDVTLSSENYHDKTESVVVEYDRKNSKNFILQPKPGEVTIIVTPQEAKISVGYKKYNADAVSGIYHPEPINLGKTQLYKALFFYFH